MRNRILAGAPALSCLLALCLLAPRASVAQSRLAATETSPAQAPAASVADSVDQAHAERAPAPAPSAAPPAPPPAAPDVAAEDGPLVAWIRTSMRRLRDLKKRPHKGETEAESLARYDRLAVDLARAARDRPIYASDPGLRRTAAMLIAVGYTESGFSPGVQSGKVRGDGGRSWCFMQANIGDGNVYVGSAEMKTWKGPDLIADPYKCFLVGAAAIRGSMGICRSLKGSDVLSAYTTGHCKENEPKAAVKWALATKIANAR